MPAKKTSAKRTTTKKSLAVRTPSTSVKKVKRVTTMKAPAVRASKPVVVATKPPRTLHLGMHFIIASSAICVMVLLGVVERNTFATKLGAANDEVPVTISLEHTAPLSMSVLFARKANAGYISITNQSNEAIHLSLPSEWTRTEVTGTTLKEVTQDIPVFGFSRWTLPGNAGMKLLMPAAPDSVLFESASETTAAIDLKTIDLATLEVSNRVVLVQKQSLVPLWGATE